MPLRGLRVAYGSANGAAIFEAAHAKRACASSKIHVATRYKKQAMQAEFVGNGIQGINLTARTRHIVTGKAWIYLATVRAQPWIKPGCRPAYLGRLDHAFVFCC